MTSKLQFSFFKKSVGRQVGLGSVETSISKVMGKSLTDDGVGSKQRATWKINWSCLALNGQK